ncbi:Phage protein [Candidatus Arthromitus sp. SFB-mouse-NL]|nr:hypothetical protein [Candidatus Arthromitus sp. SFB-mouse-NL]AID44721.1 Phage protein [Candidatus Arthromitus sp. SFB-mouse-NL]
MKLRDKAVEIRRRYLRNGVTDKQLEKYKELGILSEEEYEYIKNSNEL